MWCVYKLSSAQPDKYIFFNLKTQVTLQKVSLTLKSLSIQNGHQIKFVSAHNFSWILYFDSDLAYESPQNNIFLLEQSSDLPMLSFGQQ